MKARKQGNALVLSIPAKLDVKEGTDYMVMKEANAVDFMKVAKIVNDGLGFDRIIGNL